MASSPKWDFFGTAHHPRSQEWMVYLPISPSIKLAVDADLCLGEKLEIDENFQVWQTAEVDPFFFFPGEFRFFFFFPKRIREKMLSLVTLFWGNTWIKSLFLKPPK